MIEIKHRWTDAILWSGEAESLRAAVIAAVTVKTNLWGANLGGANLRDANLGGADLGGANLAPVRDDVWAVLSSAPSEAQAVLDALRAGRIDGSVYGGECACLVGTIAQARGCDHTAIPGLTPQPSRPAEVFFAAISPGDTPETSQPCALAAEWVAEWIGRMQAAFGGDHA